jgi:hypothetical protein
MPGEQRILTRASNEAEGEMISQWLSEAGIHSRLQLSASNILLGAGAPRDVYVAAEDYDRARTVINLAD